jgi:putative flippase GtrA
MSTSNKKLLMITSISFLIFGVLGIFTVLINLAYIADYNITNPASLPWEVYYGLLFVGSLNYSALGLCGVIYRNKVERHYLLRRLCFGALGYICVGGILWFTVYARAYDEHVAIAITEIALGLVASFILFFSISRKG